MMNSDLNQAERATNAETWKHINLVMKLLASAQIKNSTYGSDEYKGFLEAMKPALDHHYSHNRHHPEFFKNEVEEMNLFDILEMFIDWTAACQRHADGNILKSIEINKDRFNISPQLVQILKNTVPWVKDEFAGLKTQRDIKA